MEGSGVDLVPFFVASPSAGVVSRGSLTREEIVAPPFRTEAIIGAAETATDIRPFRVEVLR